MLIHLLAVGDRMPAWVQQGYEEYAKRLPQSCALHLTGIVAARRGRNAPIARMREEETRRLLDAIPRGAHVVALEVDGAPGRPSSWQRLEAWLGGGRDSRCWSAAPTA
jgi:23S rRNA (pseudouridine1915-N3)-methyltransferase